VLQRLHELPIPAVGVANRPATWHSDYLLVGDMLLTAAGEREPADRSPRQSTIQRRDFAAQAERGRDDHERARCCHCSQAAPCSARAATSRLIEGASAHASEKAPKAAIPAVNTRRSPQTSPSEPPSRISEPSESR
jgi:hypothetical protein